MERFDNDMLLLSKISILVDILAILYMVIVGFFSDNYFYLILKLDFVIVIFVNKIIVIIVF